MKRHAKVLVQTQRNAQSDLITVLLDILLAAVDFEAGARTNGLFIKIGTNVSLLFLRHSTLPMLIILSPPPLCPKPPVQLITPK